FQSDDDLHHGNIVNGFPHNIVSHNWQPHPQFVALCARDLNSFWFLATSSATIGNHTRNLPFAHVILTCAYDYGNVRGATLVQVVSHNGQPQPQQFKSQFENDNSMIDLMTVESEAFMSEWTVTCDSKRAAKSKEPASHC
ncbi:hypothetical protein V502_01598, partial [Pseudogymnoascus sp. VKM F-4520 (FW-2644)]